MPGTSFWTPTSQARPRVLTASPIPRRRTTTSRTARQALGYRELLAHVEDGDPLEERIEEAVRRTRSYARRQASWFRRDPRITWAGPEDAVELVERALGAHDARP